MAPGRRTFIPEILRIQRPRENTPRLSRNGRIDPQNRICASMNCNRKNAITSGRTCSRCSTPAWSVHLRVWPRRFTTTARRDGSRIWDDPVAKTNLLKYSIDGYFIGTVLSYSGPSTTSMSQQAGIGIISCAIIFRILRTFAPVREHGTKERQSIRFVKLGYRPGRLPPVRRRAGTACDVPLHR